MTTFFAGLDLGQAHDSTAVALLVRNIERDQTRYAVRHLKRWPPGSHYPRIAEDVNRLLDAVPNSRCQLVMDQTAVESAVAKRFRVGDTARMRQVLISSGHSVSSGDDGCTLVPKKEPVSVLQMLLQTQCLRIAADLFLAEALSREMASFRANVKVVGGAEEVSWRERAHDDLVLAVALAAWEGERNPPSVAMPIALGERGGWAWGYGW